PLLVANFVEIPIAFLGDTHRRKLLIIAGGVVFVASVVLTAVSDSFWPLLGALLLFSPASGAFVALSEASLADVEPARREQNMARWTAAGFAGRSRRVVRDRTGRRGRRWLAGGVFRYRRPGSDRSGVHATSAYRAGERRLGR